MTPEEFKFNWLRDNKTKYEEAADSYLYTGDMSEAISLLSSTDEIGLPLSYSIDNGLVTVLDAYGSYFGTGETEEEAERYFVGAVLHS